jgi:predicted amidohydrolase YtcJ
VYTVLLAIGLSACGGAHQQVDLIVHNAKVYTVDSSFAVVEAFAVKDGQFVAVGSSQEILSAYQAANTIDAQGQPVYPGFFDAHCHFYGYGMALQEANLVGIASYEAMLDTLKAFAAAHPEQPWLLGRGWDQNNWLDKEFPTKDALDTLFPNKPVYLVRVDGHAALVNQKALDLAGITASTRIDGGAILLKNGQPTGVLIDNAFKQVGALVPAPDEAIVRRALQQAEQNCFAVGLTTLSDAGLDYRTIDLIDQMQQKGVLQIRVYAMLSASRGNLSRYLDKGIYSTERLNVRSFKIYADGALGSRGACLLAPYRDKPDEMGFLLASPAQLDSLVGLIGSKGFQVNTHCIGDSANRLLLDIYGKYLQEQNDRRWRIEHAQVLDPNDFVKFAKYSVIPSVQPTHCTSDMYWAEERLGKDRIPYAYAYHTLLQQNGMVALGSDFPVEDISPLYGFHAAVVRQDAKGFPQGGFQKQEALSREDALRGMTIWAAHANFEEKIKGSIEAGKYADFVILAKDLMNAPETELRNIPIQATFVAGKEVYRR